MIYKKKIFFRADASSKIGYGHFIRSLALADILKNDFDVTFFTVEPSEYQNREMEKVCHYVMLKEETKFEDFLNALHGDEIVVLDNYFYTTENQQAIKDKNCKLVCIDDPRGIHYVCDVLISHGFYDEVDFDCEPYTQKCVGISWAMLRKPFLQPLSTSKRNNDIVVSFGGADAFHITDKIVSMLLQLQPTINHQPSSIKVILGDKMYLSEQLRAKVEILPNLSAERMVELFDTCSFGILTASTVCIEAICRGLPVIAGYDVDNQKCVYSNMKKMEIISPLDHLQVATEKKISRAIDALPSIKKYMMNPMNIPSRFIQIFNSL